jgi:ATP-dependent helicase/nuclease subunit B
MTWLLEQLSDCDFAAKHCFYIDGFPDFTRQNMAIIEHLLSEAPQVVISLNCDAPDADAPAFEKAGQTAGQIIRAAKRLGVPLEIRQVQAEHTALSKIRSSLFQGAVKPDSTIAECLSVYRGNSLHDECCFVAERIFDLVRGGARYRDISVVCTNISAYRSPLQMAFDRFHIPLYLSGTEEVMDKSVIHTVLSAVDAALGGFEQADMLRYLKAALSPVDMQTCDNMENYAVIWGVRGSHWQKEWTNHPDGLGEPWTEQSRQVLAQLEQARSLAVEPLVRLRKGLTEGRNVKAQVQSLYDFLNELHFGERLEVLADEMDREGDNRSAQILNQLWEILLQALDQLSDVLGETAWDADTFTRLLRLLLSRYNVGTIPTVLDSVVAGPVSAMRCQQSEHLFVLGAEEGSFPAYAGSSGILSDRERVALRQLGVPLTGGADEGLMAEFADIYGVFCGARKTVCVSCAGSQPSYIYRRLKTLVNEKEASVSGCGTARRQDIAAELLRFAREEQAAEWEILEEYEKLASATEHSFGDLKQDTVEKLYGTKLRLSASQVDKLADCRLAYFLKYGIRAKERKTAEVDPAEFGTYVHAVLELTAKDVMAKGGFHEVSLGETLEIADAHSEKYISERFSEIQSERLQYLFRRNARELKMVVEELWQELQKSSFEPYGFEVGFGDGKELPAVEISGQKLQAQLRGFVDRVDVWNKPGQNYFRVVDYKTGKKDFDYCDIFNGLGLQMLLYLFALEDAGEKYLGEKCAPAGVQYFPARAPLVSADGQMTDEEAATAREKLWKRKGLLLQNEAVLDAMEPGENISRLSFTRKKDGSLSGDLADSSQFRLLKTYVFQLLGNMVDEIASGKLEANPYTRGSSHNACTYCPYGSICHPEYVENRRNYKMMTAQRFWEEVDREVKKNG